MKKLTHGYHKKLSILVSVFIIINSMSTVNHEYKQIKKPNHINNYLGSDVCGALKAMRKQYIVKKIEVKKQKPMEFTVTAYDLSFNSCQKSRGTEGYGITASGYDLRGHTMDSARIISVDPHIIPLGSKVRLTFKEDKYKRYDNIYTALDKGGLIKGRKIDLFVGDNVWSRKRINDFGVAECEVEIIKED